MKPLTADLSEEELLRRLLRSRESSLNRQLGVTMFCGALAYGLCLLCTQTGVFLTGRALGFLAFLPGMLLLFTGSFIARRFGCGDDCGKWVKHVLLLSILLAILDVSLIQLVWAVPCLVGFAATVFAYHNTRITVIYTILIYLSIILSAVLNSWWGFPNPDMIPYPSEISGIPGGFVNLWAVEHPEAWSKVGYFLRVLRLHTLPLLFLMMIVTGCGYGMARRTRNRLKRNLEQTRRIQEIETCLLLMAGGNQSHELIMAVLGTTAEELRANPPLSADFVASIPAAEIPRLMRAFRARCESDPTYAELAARDPEAALKAL